MALKFLSSAFLAAFVFVFISAQQQDITQLCVGCICEASSGCNMTQACTEDICGPFHMTYGYWADSGRPTLNGQRATDYNAYTNCANDIRCAAQAVQGYMAKYGKDCNNDGYVNCDDYMRIHYLGGYGCTGSLPPKYERAYFNCRNSYQ